MTQSAQTLDTLAAGDSVAIANEAKRFYSDMARPQVSYSILRVVRSTKDFLNLEDGRRISKRTCRLVGQVYGKEAIPATPELIAANAAEITAEREYRAIMNLCLGLCKRMGRLHKMSLEQLRQAAALETSFQNAEATAADAQPE